MKKLLKIFINSFIIGSMLLSSVSSVFAKQVVKVSIGSTVANVNGNNTTLSVAPYIQKSSGSMMIPLRFVSTALGIDENNIKYDTNTKEISIRYNGTTAKFITGTDIVYFNGSKYTMYANDSNTSAKTEIVNGSTFIPLRALEPLFGFKIDWEEATKTAILSNVTEDKNVEATQPIVENNNNSLTEIPQAVEEQKETLSLSKEELEQQEVEKFLKLINDERAKNGLQPVEISDKLMETAQMKSDDMAKNNYFAHTDPSGYTMAYDINVCENISADFSVGILNYSSPFYNWLYSQAHKENMLDKNAKYIGLGYGYNNINNKMYYTLQLSSDDKWAN